jgi:hypothetical protein
MIHHLPETAIVPLETKVMVVTCETRAAAATREIASADTGLADTTTQKRNRMFRPWGLAAHTETETTSVIATTTVDISQSTIVSDTIVKTSVGTEPMVENRDGNVSGGRRRNASSVSVKGRGKSHVQDAIMMMTMIAMMTGGGLRGARGRRRVVVLAEVSYPKWSLRRWWRRARRVGSRLSPLLGHCWARLRRRTWRRGTEGLFGVC